MSKEMQYVAFNLNEEEYAADILAVQEIIRWTHITRVPRAPSYVKGVINLRGTVVPIISSHLRFNLPEEEITDTTRIIVFKINGAIIGMTVDHVTEVLQLKTDEIEKPQAMSTIDEEFISGIGKVDDRLLIILNLDNVLSLGKKGDKD